MSYVQDSDCNARYGTTNCAMWADLDGTWVKGAAETAAMTARRLAARDYATALFDATLRASEINFDLPLTTVPTVVVDICVKLAGYWLSTASGVSSYASDGKPLTRLYVDYRDALDTMQMIATGKIRLDL